MKKLLKSKKGFTLVELLAVIVVLAIIMVIATTQIGNAISRARSNSFIDSYKMVEKQLKTYIASDETEKILCDNTPACLKNYDLSSDYSLYVTQDTADSTYTIYMGAAGIFEPTRNSENTITGYEAKKAATDGTKFKNLDLTKYGDGKTTDSHGKVACSASKISSTAEDCGSNFIKGSIGF